MFSCVYFEKCMGTHDHAACNAHVRAWQQRNNMRVCSLGLANRATLVHIRLQQHVSCKEYCGR